MERKQVEEQADGQGDVFTGGREESWKPQTRPSSATVANQVATGAGSGPLLFGLSERVRLGGIGSLDHIPAASPSWQLCLAKARRD